MPNIYCTTISQHKVYYVHVNINIDTYILCIHVYVHVVLRNTLILQTYLHVVLVNTLIVRALLSETEKSLCYVPMETTYRWLNPQRSMLHHRYYLWLHQSLLSRILGQRRHAIIGLHWKKKACSAPPGHGRRGFDLSLYSVGC